MAEVLERETFIEAVSRLLDGRKLPWLVARTGIPYRRLSRLMNANEAARPAKPTLDEAVAIARAFDVEMETLLGDSGDGDSASIDEAGEAAAGALAASPAEQGGVE